MSGRLTEAELLRAAREGLSPSAEEESRVWMRVGSVVLSSPSPPSPEAYGPPNAAVGHAGMSAMKLAAIALGVGATLGFGAGYTVGNHRAESRAIASGVARKPLQPAELVAPAEPAIASATSPVGQSVRSAAPANAQVDNVAAETAGRQVASAAPPKERRAPERAGRDAQSLAAEVDTLVRARRALAHGNPQLALGLLAELDGSHPKGALGEERQATRILALCAANRIPEGPLSAERFVSETPSSIYAARIRGACGLPGVTESEVAGH